MHLKYKSSGLKKIEKLSRSQSEKIFCDAELSNARAAVAQLRIYVSATANQLCSCRLDLGRRTVALCCHLELVNGLAM